MKKIIFSVFVLTIVTSCKKDRTCTCSYADGSTASQGTYTNVTRKEAKALCVSALSGVTCSIN
jgi:hypothetical protein